MKTVKISVNIEENVLKAVDQICEEYSQAKKVRYTRSQFITESVLFLMAMSQKHSEENKENKEEN